MEFNKIYNCFCSENEFLFGNKFNSDDHILLINFIKNNKDITFYLNPLSYKYLSYVNDIAVLLNKSYKILYSQ